MGATDPDRVSAASAEVTAGEAKAATGYRSYVRPDHPALERVFPPLTGDRRRDLSRALEELQGPRFVYDGFRGWAGFDRLVDRLATGGGDAVPLNCLTMAALLVSRLRGAGFGADEAFVVLGQTRSRRDTFEFDFHAWVYLRADGEVTWIDPGELEARSHDSSLALSRFAPQAVFNDAHLYFGQDAKDLLGRPASAARPKCYLYGRRDPAISELVGRSGWTDLLAGLFSSSGVPADDAPDWADEAVEHGLCRREARSLVAGPVLELVRVADVEEFRDLFRPFLEIYLDLVGGAMADLEETYSACEASRRFAWPEVVHSVVAGMLMDLAVGGNLHLYERVSEAQGPTVVCAFENLPSGNALGVRWISGRQCDFVQLWHQEVRREPVTVTPDACDVLREVAVGNAASSPQQLLWLRHLGLVRGKGPAPAPTFPVFLPEDSDRLLAAVRSAGAALVERAVLPALEAARRIGWVGAQKDRGVSFAGARLVLELAADAVIERGLLPAFPAGEEVSPAWGRWLWVQPPDGRSFRQYILSSSQPVGAAP